jgi:hypothetical protein
VLAGFMEVNPPDDAFGGRVSFLYRPGKGTCLRALSSSIRPEEKGLLDALWIRPTAASFGTAPYLPPVHELTDNQYISPMKDNKLYQGQEYQSPALRIIPVNVENAICDSTIPGGNEDIGYEDWD